MSASVAKLYSRMLDSTVMRLDAETRWIFVALIMAADKRGVVSGHDERLAVRVGVPLEMFHKAIGELSAPDPDSSSKEADGRRVERIENPSGYRIINYSTYQSGKRTKGNPAKCPTCPEALAIAAIFHMRAETEWAEKDIRAFKALHGKKLFTLPDLELCHRYYAFERAKPEEQGFHRRALGTFLNNYLETELQRAREWGRRYPKLAAAPLKISKEAVKDEEPEQFRAWLLTAYPGGNHALPWKDIPDYLREEFRNSLHSNQTVG